MITYTLGSAITANVSNDDYMNQSLNTLTISPKTVTVTLAKQMHPSLGRTRIYRATRSGALHSVRVGKRLAIPVEDLDAWVLAGAPETSPPK